MSKGSTRKKSVAEPGEDSGLLLSGSGSPCLCSSILKSSHVPLTLYPALVPKDSWLPLSPRVIMEIHQVIIIPFASI